jgi:hypothetical protein
MNAAVIGIVSTLLLLLAGCAPCQRDGVVTRGHVVETGAAFEADLTLFYRSIGAQFYGVVVQFGDGELFIDFERGTPRGARRDLSQQTGSDGLGYRVDLVQDGALACASRPLDGVARAEGELRIDDFGFTEDGCLDCFHGRLEIRFTDCPAEILGRSATEATIVVDL